MVADKCPIGPIGLNRLSPNGLIGPIRPFLPSFPALLARVRKCSNWGIVCHFVSRRGVWHDIFVIYYINMRHFLSFSGFGMPFVRSLKRRAKRCSTKNV